MISLFCAQIRFSFLGCLSWQGINNRSLKYLDALITSSPRLHTGTSTCHIYLEIIKNKIIAASRRNHDIPWGAAAGHQRDVIAAVSRPARGRCHTGRRLSVCRVRPGAQNASNLDGAHEGRPHEQEVCLSVLWRDL